jgi:hypothetical protein
MEGEDVTFSVSAYQRLGVLRDVYLDQT